MAELYSLLKRKLSPKNKKNAATKHTIAGRAMFTPTPSSANLSNGSSASSFFTVVSAELRTMILTEAFGNRTIHIHYSYFQLFEPGEIKVGTKPRPGEHAKIHLNRRKLRKSGYHWTSSVCHRKNPYLPGPSGDPGAANDCCHWEKYPAHGDRWADEAPEECLIGAMGFLLSCKQAYVECIEVLFATNTIHMGEAYLLNNLETLLLPQRLARIKSVELTWVLQEPELPEGTLPQRIAASTRQFREMVASLPRALPNLRKLTLVLSDRHRVLLDFFEDLKERQRCEQVLLGPVDELVRRFKQLEHVELALPAAYYLALQNPWILEDEWMTWRSKLNCVRNWRSLDGASEDDGSANMAGTPVGLGYWVAVGELDIPITVECL